MKVAVRPLDGAELEDGVSQLRIVAYPAFPEVHEVDYYAAIYRWYETHPLADEIHRWVATTEEGEVVGHLTAFPQFYRIEGKRIVAHTPGDYMVLPQHGFQAIVLMRSFFRATENCVVCDMLPAVIGVETRLGAEVAGGLQYAAKLMNVSRLPMPPVPASVRRLLNLPEQQFSPARRFIDRPGAGTDDTQEYAAPPAPRPRAPIPGPLVHLLNRAIEVVDEALSKNASGNLEAEVLDGFDDSFDGLFESVAAVMPCLPEKDAAFLRWRYGPDCPQAPVTVIGVRSGGRLLGYAVLKAASQGQDGYVLDLMALPGRRDVILALLQETVRQFRLMGVQIIRYRFLESPSSPRQADLRRLGFFFRKARSNKLLVKFADSGRHALALDLTNWSYNLGDGEASFWLR